MYIQFLIRKYFIIHINNNFFKIIQNIAHKNNLIYMFKDPMTWCKENLDEFGSYFLNHKRM